ncbi:MAG: hypothetical protein QGG26_17415, partial [Candidatus Undinarchaeales archaeon]|nr:hypothetical protein [Candidatus Undinarchaeales archaeon]
IIGLSAKISSSSVIVTFLNIVLLGIYIKSVGASEYGRFSSIILATSLPMMVVGFFPFGTALLYFSSKLFEEGKSDLFYCKARVLIQLNLLSSFFLAVLFALFHEPFFRDVLQKPDLIPLWPWAQILLILQAVNIYETFLLAIGRIEKSYEIRILTTCLKFTASILILLFSSFDVRLLLIIHTGVLVLNLALALYVSRDHLVSIINTKAHILEEAREIVSPTFAETSKYLKIVSMKLVDVFAVRYSTYQVITSYRIFLMLLDIAKTLVFDPLSQAFFTVASKDVTEERDKIFVRTSLLIKAPGALFILLLLLSMMFRPFIIQSISFFEFGIDPVIGERSIEIFLLLSSLISLGYLSAMIARVMHEPKLLVWTSVARLVFTIFGFFVLFHLPSQVLHGYGAMLVITTGYAGRGMITLYYLIHNLRMMIHRTLLLPICSLLSALLMLSHTSFWPLFFAFIGCIALFSHSLLTPSERTLLLGMVRNMKSRQES